MKLTLSWLKRHLDTTASLQEICDKLTAIGLEVEGVEDPGVALAPFTIAQIVTAEKHPDADRLRVCTVTTGKETLQIVCGAPNARAGLKTVLARPGDTIPRDGTVLKKGVIRGVESQGMMCSASELKISEESDGILDLPADAQVGENYAAYAGLNDPIIEINLTPNRGDCAGVRGVARDLAAAGMGKLKPLEIKMPKATEPSRIKVKLDFDAEHKKDCPLFVGRYLRNIKNGPSPAWMQRYLLAVGMRPISALVDITNFLNVDCGRPLHVFDAESIKGGVLRVWSAKGGESFKALNEKTYTLEAGMTAIGDETGMLSLAGVMGGMSSGCELTTTSVFIESAVFAAERVAQTGRKLQVTSDARYRFERGIDYAFTSVGADYAAQLVLECCGTPETVVAEPVIEGEPKAPVRTLDYDPALCLRRIGVDITVDEQAKILESLGFAVERKGKIFGLTIPTWRNDVNEAEDITEEVSRIKGFEHIPALSMPRAEVVTEGALSLLDRRAGQVRRAFAVQGLMESVTWSFTSAKVAAEFGPINEQLRLLNPISIDLEIMRPSILGNLMMAAKRNADRGFSDVALFEVGPVYKDQTPEGQSLVATALRSGTSPRHWATPSRPVDAFDAKADALAALAAAGAPVGNLQVTTDAPAWYHPGRSGALRLGPTVLAVFGELHPSFVQACDATGPAVGCEIYLAALPQPRTMGTAKPLLKLEDLQPVSRDFAFVMEEAVTAEKVIKAVKGVDKTLIRDVSVFDVYMGDRVGAGKKSVALSVQLQPADHTLTEAELEDVSKKIESAVSKATGAVLRT